MNSDIGETTMKNTPRNSMPTLEIPQDYRLDGTYPEFQIPTPDGNVRVEAASAAFYCSGTAGALVACGLVHADWLPGHPGNNSVMQSVVFAGGRAVLLKGRHQTIAHPRNQRLVIKRRGKDRYQVRLPTTKAQEEFIREIEQRRRREAERPTSTWKPESPGDFRGWCADLADSACNVSRSGGKHFGFAFDPDSQERIDWARGQLVAAFLEGVIVAPQPDLQREGNVVYLRPRSAE